MMVYEYFYEYFMNTFMNTFLRGMNTFDTLRVYNYFLLKKKNKVYINQLRWLIYIIYMTGLKVRVCVCVCHGSIHSIHQQIQSIGKSIHQVYIQPYIFGG